MLGSNELHNAEDVTVGLTLPSRGLSPLPVTLETEAPAAGVQDESPQ